MAGINASLDQVSFSVTNALLQVNALSFVMLNSIETINLTVVHAKSGHH